MMTAKGKYCLKALACLASLEPGAKMQAIDIAKKQDIPKNFLDVILNDLRHAGIISSKKGLAAAICLLEVRARYELVRKFV